MDLVATFGCNTHARRCPFVKYPNHASGATLPCVQIPCRRLLSVVQLPYGPHSNADPESNHGPVRNFRLQHPRTPCPRCQYASRAWSPCVPRGLTAFLPCAIVVAVPVCLRVSTTAATPDNSWLYAGKHPPCSLVGNNNIYILLIIIYNYAPFPFQGRGLLGLRFRLLSRLPYLLSPVPLRLACVP